MAGRRLPVFAFALVGAWASLSAPALARETVPLDAGWRFQLGDAPDAALPTFDDSGWRSVELPHDWSIEGKTSPSEASAGGGGFFPTGVGWYRQTFRAPSSWGGRHVSVVFDGVYRNAEVWINGRRLGLHPYGYTPFQHDLTPHLRLDSENTLAVRVDNSSQPNSPPPGNSAGETGNPRPLNRLIRRRPRSEAKPFCACDTSAAKTIPRATASPCNSSP